MNFRVTESLITLLFVWVVLSSAKISSEERSTEFVDYVKNLAEELGILQEENVRFVFDEDFFNRNSNAADKTRLTAVLDASSIANCFRVHLAFVKSFYNATFTDLNMKEENGVSLAWNAQHLPVKITSTTDLYDISWVLDEWKAQQKSPGRLNITFNLLNSGRKESRKRAVKKWSLMSEDRAWLKKGPVFLVAYFKDTANTQYMTSQNLSADISRAHKLRSGAPSTCKLHTFQTNFTQLNLHSVYLSPAGLFNLGVCFGPCDPTISVDSRVPFMTSHAWFLELALEKRVPTKSPVQRIHLKSTCVATEYYGQRVLKKDGETTVSLYIKDFSASVCSCR